MSLIGLTTGEAFLRDSARTFFESHYESRPMHLEKKLHNDLEWTPALRFTIRDYINVFVEPSEIGPYPRLLKLKYADVQNFPQPIAIYAVCPQDMITSRSQQSEMKELQNHGFGLVTVDQYGQANRLFSAMPLVQVISNAEFKDLLKGLPLKIRQRVSEAFDDYLSQPVNGVKTLTEIIEGLVKRAGSDAVKKNHVSKNKLGNGTANILDALYETDKFNKIRAEIGGVRGHIKTYRNISHHWPKNKQQAYNKYNDCRHAFLGGSKQIRLFLEAIKREGLSGRLP